MPAAGYAAGGRKSPPVRITEQCRLIEIEFSRGDIQLSYLQFIATPAFVSLKHMLASDQSCGGKVRPSQWRMS